MQLSVPGRFALQVALSPIIHAEVIAADTQDGQPALVLKRTPSHALLHLASLVSCELRLPAGITFQVRHTCSPQQCSAWACGDGSVLGPCVCFFGHIMQLHVEPSPARARVW